MGPSVKLELKGQVEYIAFWDVVFYAVCFYWQQVIWVFHACWTFAYSTMQILQK